MPRELEKALDDLYSEDDYPRDASKQQQEAAAFIIWYESDETKRFITDLVDVEINRVIVPGEDLLSQVAQQNAFKVLKQKLAKQYKNSQSIVGVDNG